MALDNTHFGSPYLAENSKTSFPTVGVPANTSAPAGDSELRALCDLSIHGRGLYNNDDMLGARLSAFGASLPQTGSLPTPGAITNEYVQVYSKTHQTNGGIVFISLTNADGDLFFSTADSINTFGCQNGLCSASPPSYRYLRHEEILRGEYIHGFAQLFGYFLTYVVHYPTFYEFFNTDGYNPGYVTYGSSVYETVLVSKAVIPQADYLESVDTSSYYAATIDDMYPDTPILTPDDQDKLDAEIANYHLLEEWRTNIILLNKNDFSASSVSLQEIPCDICIPDYLEEDTGALMSPEHVEELYVLECAYEDPANPDTFLSNYSDLNICPSWHPQGPVWGDQSIAADYGVLIKEGYNVELRGDIETNSITFGAIPGAGAGYGPEYCEPDPLVRTINGAGPDEVGDIYIGGSNCIVVGPDTNTSVPEADLVSSHGYGTALTKFKSYRMFDGHPLGEPSPDPEDCSMGDELCESKLMISGFCSQCCSCNNYEKMYKALEKAAAPLWDDINPTPPEGYEGPWQWDDTGLLHRANKTTEMYNCIVTQYTEIRECFRNKPVVVSSAGWGHYGYLVSAQVLIQNHGEFELTGNLEITFDFGDVGEVEYVDKTSYANIDEGSIEDSDFNPAQPLETLLNNGAVTIQPAAGNTSAITLKDGFLNLEEGRGIGRGRYMMVGILVYLKDQALDDNCGVGGSGSTSKGLTTYVEGIDNVEDLEDTNGYECLSTLFLPTPCTPALITATWVDQDTSELKIKLTEDISGLVVPLTISWETHWVDWVVGEEAEGQDVADMCGHDVTYEPPIDSTLYNGYNRTIQAISVNGLMTVPLSDLPIIPDGNDEDCNDGATCGDCEADGCCCVDGELLTPSELWGPDQVPEFLHTYNHTENCVYKGFASKLLFTIQYDANVNPVSLTCGNGETVLLESFSFTAVIMPTITPPTIFYHCHRLSDGINCHIPCTPIDDSSECDV